MIEEALALPPEMLLNVERYAVYRCYSDQGQLLYVGESGELGVRFASHAQKAWFQQVRGVTFEWYADELSALNAERRAIHIEHPKYNKQHRKTTSAQVSKAKTRKRSGRLVPADATDDELVTLVLQHVEGADALNSYRVTRVIKDQCGGRTVGFNRSKVILELAQRHVTAIGASRP